MTVPKKTRDALRERAHDCCEICGVWGANNAHHRRNQSQGGPDILSNLLLLCGSGTTGCHGRIGREPAIAGWLGWTITDTTPPDCVRVLRFDLVTGERGFALLDDDGGIEYLEAA